MLCHVLYTLSAGAPGLAAISRFHRLELIDPTADAAASWQKVLDQRGFHLDA